MNFNDLSAERQNLLRAYAAGCYSRALELGAWNSHFGRPLAPYAVWTENCMQSILDGIEEGEGTWEEIENIQREYYKSQFK